MDMARSTRLVMLIKHMYTVWGRKRVRIYILYEDGNVSFTALQTSDEIIIRLQGYNK